MKNLYLDIDKKEQASILNELKQRIGLSWRKLASNLGVSRSILRLYLDGKHRMSYVCLIKLCNLAKADLNDYAVKLIEINNKPKTNKLYLPLLNENEMRQALAPEDWQKIVAVGLLTDGTVHLRNSDGRYNIAFFSSDIALHECFNTIVKIGFNENNTSFTKNKNDDLYLLYYQKSKNNNMVKKLFEFSKIYVTKFLEYKPSLDFIFDSELPVKIMAIRFAMSTDGSVSIKTSKNKSSFALRLACAHPSLVEQWRLIFSDVGIDMRIDKDKATFSGIHGLVTSRKASFLRFKEIGGFFPNNVKVTNGNYVGLMKNQVLNVICNCLENKNRNINSIKTLLPNR